MAKLDRLYIRISEDIKQELQEAAKAENRTISNYVETLIKEDLAGRRSNGEQ